MKILITGDLVVRRDYKASEQIDQNVIRLFAGSDYRIINLEAPLTESNHRIPKTGPHIKGNKKSTRDILKALQINIATLANNHLKDYGEQGVLDTLDFCRNNGIEPTGAGENSSEASGILYLDSNEGKIAVLNIAENEWASATENNAGANGMHLIRDIKKIREAKNNASFVIIIVHGGHEHYNLPSPRIKELYRFYAEEGADLVVGHHTHCISGYEIYNNVPIYYSLGNFLFPSGYTMPDWYKGLVLEVTIRDRKIQTSLHTIVVEKESFKLRLANETEKKETERHILEYNSIISDDKKLNEAWTNYVSAQQKQYLYYWSPLSSMKGRRLVGALLKLQIDFSSKRGRLLNLNLLRCESHRDLSEEVLSGFLKNN